MRISHWLTRFQNRRPARKTNRRVSQQTTESLERRTLLTTVGVLTGPTDLTIFVDDGDSATVQRNQTTGNVEVLDANGQPYQSIPSIQASLLTSLNIFADDADNTLSVAPVNAAEFSALSTIVIDAGDGDDVITGSDDFAEMIDGGDGNDVITGGGGSDTIDAGDGNDLVTGGAGLDSIFGGNGQDTIDGGAGNDNIDAGDGQDSVDGGTGDDTINAGDGLDTVNGGAGADSINGMSGVDLLNGDDGNDTILGGSENDIVNGGDGNDIVNGQAGNDTVNGDAGDDTAYGGGGRDSLLGGDGNDIVNGQSGNDTGIGNDGDDTIYGGRGDDSLFGDAFGFSPLGTGNDVVRGHSGNDTISGGGGADRLLGDSGNDLVQSGDIASDITPLFSIDVQASVVEGSAGTTSVVVNVQLQRAFSTSVSVNYTTVDGTATLANNDYVATSGTLTFTPGVTTRSISVDVVGDMVSETDEFFTVDLSNPVGGVIISGQGQVVIVNDDLWTPQGPTPIINGQTENVMPNNEVVGAVHTLAAHPTDADILYLGGTNGGIWRTTNATTAVPTWESLTDNLTAQSIGAMILDPSNPDRILAGIGTYSSFGRTGSNRDGLLLSEDGGDTWSQIMDPVLTGENISGVVLHGNLLVASASFVGGGTGGLFRSTDNGATWTTISGTGGLPNTGVHDLVEDPTDPNRFYAAVQSVGIFMTTDAGVNWTNISTSDAVLSPIISAASNNNTEMAVASNGRLYIAVLQNGQAQYIGFTDNQGGAWSRMDLPMTPDAGGGADEGLNPRNKPGGQGAIHFSIVVDPNDPNTVYVGGDRQDTPFPNFIGAVNFTGRLFRGDTTVAPTGAVPSPQWEHLTHSDSVAQTPGGGTASSSSPHADSREMVFLANGDLIEGDDGGIYRRTSPQDNSGDWFSLNGSLQITEIHDVAYDTISNIIVSGNQDTGSSEQESAGSTSWRTVNQGDGGDVAIDTITLAAMNQSIRYTSAQTLLGIRRRVVDANNNVISSTGLALAVQGNGAAIVPQFSTPVIVNEVDGTRLIIGGANSTYESFDMGDTVTEVGPSIGVNGGFGDDAVSYGGFMGATPNADVLYVGSGNSVFVRTTGTGAPIQAATYPGGRVRDIVLDSTNFNTAFVIDSNQVFQTTDAGTTWTDVTGDLINDDLRTIEYISGVNDLVTVGTRRGVYVMDPAVPGMWVELDASLPTVPVWDMDYDAVDDVLVIGTLGRGAWLFQNASQVGTAVNPLPPAPTPTVLVALGDTIDGGSGNDTILGADGDDLINGTSGNDFIRSGLGDDTINGGDGDDTIDGGDGDDSIAGQSGDDVITGGAGIDTVIWNGLGNGSDTILASDGAETLTVQGDSGVNNYTVSSNSGLLRVAEGAASITVAASTTTINVNGGSDNDVITITSLADVNPLVLNIDGQADNDTITAVDANIGEVRLRLNGGTGNDTITGSRDSDSINGDGGDDLVFGGLGNDSVDGGDGNDTLNGEAGNDFLFGNIGNDLMDGGDGDDIVSGGLGNDTAIGGVGNDTLLGGFGDDVLNGNSGDDLADGGRDNDQVLGGSGDDSLKGGTGDDTIRGQSGDDLIKGGDGNDRILGDAGIDIIDGGDGDDDVDAGNGDDIVAGGDGNDTLNGMSGADTLLGGNGNDNQLGGAGVDSLYGEEGDDSLNGGSSTDQFNGGEGVDVLISPDAGEFDNNNLLIQTSVLQALALLNGF